MRFLSFLFFFFLGSSMALGSVHITDPLLKSGVSFDELLFPPIKPFEESRLAVSPPHSLWYAQYGNEKGLPVVVLHGGPGAGCGDKDMRYFDPERYRIILFDQRGAKRSRPVAELKDNTPQHLVDDMEALRTHLKIDKWLIWGGSWGTALGILYGETYPDRCLGFVLRGVFTAQEEEIRQVWNMQDLFPEKWEKCHQFIPAAERDDLIEAYYKRLVDPDPAVHFPAAHAFLSYDLYCAFLFPQDELLRPFLEDKDVLLPVARIFAHYCRHRYFLEKNQIWADLHKIVHLPAFFINGRYDSICRPKTAYQLHKNWPGSRLTIVSDAGHAPFEPGIAKVLVEIAEELKERKWQ